MCAYRVLTFCVVLEALRAGRTEAQLVSGITPFVLSLPFRPSILPTLALVKFRAAAAIASYAYNKRKKKLLLASTKDLEQNETMHSNSTEAMNITIINTTEAIPDLPPQEGGYGSPSPKVPSKNSGMVQNPLPEYGIPNSDIPDPDPNYQPLRPKEPDKAEEWTNHQFGSSSNSRLRRLNRRKSSAYWKRRKALHVKYDNYDYNYTDEPVPLLVVNRKSMNKRNKPNTKPLKQKAVEINSMKKANQRQHLSTESRGRITNTRRITTKESSTSNSIKTSNLPNARTKKFTKFPNRQKGGNYNNSSNSQSGQGAADLLQTKLRFLRYSSYKPGIPVTGPSEQSAYFLPVNNVRLNRSVYVTPRPYASIVYGDRPKTATVDEADQAQYFLAQGQGSPSFTLNPFPVPPFLNSPLPPTTQGQHSANFPKDDNPFPPWIYPYMTAPTRQSSPQDRHSGAFSSSEIRNIHVGPGPEANPGFETVVRSLHGGTHYSRSESWQPVGQRGEEPWKPVVRKRRSVPAESGETLLELGIDRALGVLLEKDQLGCSLRLVCQLSTFPNTHLEEDEAIILEFVRIQIQSKSGRRMSPSRATKAFGFATMVGRVGEHSGDIGVCSRVYDRCPFSGAYIMHLLRNSSL